MNGKRLQFVVGKGGVGKSTVAAALAIAEVGRTSGNVLVVELGSPGGVARLFGVAPSKPGVAVEVRPRLSLAYVDGESALAEYLELIVPIRRLLATVFASRIYRFFVAAAPGLKELMTVGKIRYENQRTDADGRPRWTAIVVDAGASGHSLQYLQMPTTAVETFRSGLVHREAKRVEALLKDASRTAVHVVTLPEEMPVNEALQIVSRLRDDLGLPIGELVVNRCRRAAPEGAAGLAARLSQRGLADSGSTAEPPRDEVLAGVWLSAARALAWQEIQVHSVARFERGTGVAALRLPLLITEEFGVGEVETLAKQLSVKSS